MSKITATIANTDREKIRLSLGLAMVNKYGYVVNENRWSTGISLDSVYVGRRWFVVEFHSIWDRGNGQTVGTYYVAYDMTSRTDRSCILSICERLEVEPPAMIEVVAD